MKDKLWEAIEFLEKSKQIISEIKKDSILSAVDMLYEAWEDDNQVFIIGNGGSASIATHFACDLNKPLGFKALALVDNIPLVSALTNDDGWNNIYINQLKTWLYSGDIVIGISVHGGKGKDKAGKWSQNLLRAMNYAKSMNAKTISLVGFDGGIMKEISDISILVPANSTPQVEGIFPLLTHLICHLLKKRIEE